MAEANVELQEKKLAEEEMIAKSLPAGSADKERVEAQVAQQEEVVDRARVDFIFLIFCFFWLLLFSFRCLLFGREIFHLDEFF